MCLLLEIRTASPFLNLKGLEGTHFNFDFLGFGHIVPIYICCHVIASFDLLISLGDLPFNAL